MIDTEEKLPYCYGKLEEVFPKGADGLRHVPESCLVCLYKTRCLRSAMDGAEGITVKEERVDQAYDSGMIGFFDRWSRKKALNKKRKKKP